jgi:hypothetical protein
MLHSAQLSGGLSQSLSVDRIPLSTLEVSLDHAERTLLENLEICCNK